MAPKAHENQLALPLSVVGPVDLGRLIRELETLDGGLTEAELRKDAEVKLPKTTRLLDTLIELNKADLLNAEHRKGLLVHLRDIQTHAPLLHMSFSADPSPLFTDKLMGWLRNEIHPQVLLTVGLQPSIGAGCLVRTTNKFFDFTLRENFQQKSGLLMEALRKVETQDTPA